jgi:cytochrome c oxidase accessory protein FixG
MSFEKFFKRSTKHLVWLAIALWTGFTFVGYFSSIRELGTAFLHAQMGSWEVFWVFFYGFATYGNAGFMREQVCKYMCPYARFQGAMFDRDTLIVSYDGGRGEPRGPRSKLRDVRGTSALGDCIDCGLCVQVCPTGIDIRDGLQYECIGCGLCVDACNGVMDKMEYPRGLVRYATQNGLAAGWTARQVVRRILRPRVLVYGAVLVVLTTGLLISLVVRMPLKVDVVRDRGSLARIVEGGKLENVYRLQIMNATEAVQQYRIRARGIEGIAAFPQEPVVVEGAQSRWVAVQIQIPYGGAASGSHKVYLDVQSVDGRSEVSEKTTFVVPR